MYKYLSARKDGRDCVLVGYRHIRPGKIDPDTSRRYGETGQSEAVQLEAGRKWWPVAPARQAAAGMACMKPRCGGPRTVIWACGLFAGQHDATVVVGAGWIGLERAGQRGVPRFLGQGPCLPA